MILRSAFLCVFLSVLIGLKAQQLYISDSILVENYAPDKILINGIGLPVLYNQKNIFLLTDSFKLKKTFNLPYKISQPYQLDVSNPFKNVLFLTDYKMVYILDNQLTIRSQFLPMLAGSDPLSACASKTGNIWVLDRADKTPKQFNESGVVQRKGNELLGNMILWNAPIQTIENNMRLFLLDTASGISVLDMFGNFIKKIPLKGLNKIQFLTEKYILYFIGKDFYVYDMERLKETRLGSLGNIKDFSVFQDKVYFLSQENMVFIYNIK